MNIPRKRRYPMRLLREQVTVHVRMAPGWVPQRLGEAVAAALREFYGYE